MNKNLFTRISTLTLATLLLSTVFTSCNSKNSSSEQKPNTETTLVETTVSESSTSESTLPESTIAETTSTVAETTTASKTIETEVNGEKVKLLNVPYISILDIQNFPVGTELASAVMTLNYYGINVTVDTLYNFLQINKELPLYSGDGSASGASPYEFFVGDPKVSPGYGAYSPVIVNCINKYLTSINRTDLIAVDITGSTPEQLYSEITQQNPVIVWSTIQLSTPEIWTSWTTADGKRIDWQGTQDVVVLTGNSSNSIFMNDSQDFDPNVEHPKSDFENIYSQLGSRAVVIRQK